MKKLHIKLENNQAKAWSINKLEDCDCITSDYPEDFVGNEQKYNVELDEENKPIFTVKEKWEEYSEYLNNFDYGEMGENVVLSYEEWKLEN